MADKRELTQEEMEAARRAKAQYARDYRRKYPEKNKQAIARYWAKRAAMQEQANDY